MAGLHFRGLSKCGYLKQIRNYMAYGKLNKDWENCSVTKNEKQEQHKVEKTKHGDSTRWFALTTTIL
jgi:hypothetical protein